MYYQLLIHKYGERALKCVKSFWKASAQQNFKICKSIFAKYQCCLQTEFVSNARKIEACCRQGTFKHYANGPAFDCLNYENMIAKLTAMALADLLWDWSTTTCYIDNWKLKLVYLTVTG